MNNALFIVQMLRFKSGDTVGHELPTRSAPAVN